MQEQLYVLLMDAIVSKSLKLHGVDFILMIVVDSEELRIFKGHFNCICNYLILFQKEKKALAKYGKILTSVYF